MLVDVNNNFNSAEDKVQEALGMKKAYSINAYNTTQGCGCSGIIALSHSKALAKYLKHLPAEITENMTFKVILCE